MIVSKFGKTSVVLILAMLAPCARGATPDGNGVDTRSTNKIFDFPEMPLGLYDVDSDGIKEWIGTTLIGKPLVRPYADNSGVQVVRENYPYLIKWISYGSDNIGAIEKGEFLDSISIFKLDGMEPLAVYSLKSSGKALNVLDYNNDGRNDFWVMDKYNSSEDYFLTCLDDGTFMAERPVILTPQEYYDLEVGPSGGGLGSGMSVVEGNDKGAPGSFSSYQQVDINNDGLLDFIDGESGVYLMNIGDGRFVKDSFAGRVMFRDFDGDGLNDMFAYDDSSKTLSVVFQRKEGDSRKVKLFSGFACGDRIWCHDFDKDGDIDILVPFNSEDNNGQSFLLMFENKGDGSFKKHEYYIDGYDEFRLCHDIDNDGNYEILSKKRESSGAITLNSYKISGLDVGTDPEVLHDNVSDMERDDILVGDWNNSGIQNILFMTGEGGFYNETLLITPEGDVNTRPDRPAAPEFFFEPASGSLTVKWNIGNDKETAPLDLTYELRIGTAPGKCDILWVDALPDGSRRNLEQGNCGYSIQRRFDTSSWPAGKIYISLQTVDGNGMGSEFSDYAVFEKNLPAVAFVIETPQICAVTDECVIRLQSAMGQDVKYTWDFDGAEILSQNDSEIHLYWLSPGEKTVTLTASSNGSSASLRRTVGIVPARLEKGICSEYGDAVEIYYAMDIDLDGKSEVLSYSDRFLEDDGNGNYSKVKKLFNSNFNIPSNTRQDGGIRAADINRDGMPDLYLSDYEGTGRRWIDHLINEGDKSMDIVSNDVPDFRLLVPDLDNDGFADSYYQGRLYRNSSDYINFVEKENSGNRNTVHWYDYDGDGLTDRIESESRGSVVTFYRNNGGFAFAEEQRLEDMKAEAVGDIDGNGKTDMAWTLTTSGFGLTTYSDFVYIRWNDGAITEIPALAGHKFSFIRTLFDFDNNGCLDILTRLDNADDVIIFMKPDHMYQIVNCGNRKFDRLYAYPAYPRSDGRTGFGGYRIIGARNTAPSIPSGLKATQNDDALVIEWSPATDSETPSPALRYNISIKHKGKDGEGAYFWSPLNGGKNGVPLPSTAQLLNSTVLTIPNGAIAPGEYEVRVQAVDTQMQPGDFSETLVMNVKALNLVSMPAETMVGKSTELNLTSGYTAGDFDFGTDAIIDQEVGSTVWVRWMSEGMKTVSCGDFSKTILVHPALDASFSLPAEVIAGSKVRFECDNLHNSEWHVYAHRDFESFKPLKDWFIDFTPIDDSHGELCFRHSLGYDFEIRHTLTEDYGSDVFSSVTRVYALKESPAITIVDIDETTGKHRLQWRMPAELDGVAQGVNVYKETSRIGEYELLTDLPLGSTSIVDDSSDPVVMASRYCISFGLPYGETAMSVAHQPIHLQVNSGGKGIWNLYWGKYEGRDITSYRILRGLTPESMECIAEVSGSVTSYSDIDGPTSDGYYAVEILLDDVMQTRSQTMLRSRSNIVSIAELAGVDAVVDDVAGALVAVESVSGENVEVSGIIVCGSHPSVLRIYNVTGQLLHVQNVASSEATVPFSSHPAGVYLVTVDGASRQTARFIKR